MQVAGHVGALGDDVSLGERRVIGGDHGVRCGAAAVAAPLAAGPADRRHHRAVVDRQVWWRIGGRQNRAAGQHRAEEAREQGRNAAVEERVR